MSHPDTGWPVLYLDDNPDDHLLVHEAVALLRAPLRIQSVTQPSSALEYLNRAGRFADRSRYPSPVLGLLDYDLDGVTSIDLLRWIRLQAQFTNVPVVMYSGSDMPACIALAYYCGADHFIIKPAGFLRVEAFLRTLCECLATEPLSYEPFRQLPEYRPPPQGMDFPAWCVVDAPNNFSPRPSPPPN